MPNVPPGKDWLPRSPMLRLTDVQHNAPNWMVRADGLSAKESYMTWPIQLATGIERVDQQHQMLFQVTDDDAASLNAGHGERVYGQWLSALDQYARGHFGFEEQCMHRNVVRRRRIRSEHAEFLETLSRFRAHFAAVGFVQVHAHALVDFLNHWLVTHIGRVDVMRKACVNGP